MIDWVVEDGSEDSQAVAAAILTRQNLPATVHVPVGTDTALLDYFDIKSSTTDTPEEITGSYVVRDQPYSPDLRAQAWIFSFGRTAPEDGLVLDIDGRFYPVALYDQFEMLAPAEAIETMGISPSEATVGTTRSDVPGTVIPGFPVYKFLRAFTVIRDHPARALAAQCAVGGVNATWGSETKNAARSGSAPRDPLSNRALEAATELELDFYAKTP